VEYEQYAFINRATGPYWWAYWSMMTCNVISPQVLWIGKLRRNIAFSWVLSIIVNIGMWFERFVIIVTSLHRDYIPSSWAMFYPTWVDVSIFIGSIGVFFTLFLLFIRVLPSVAMAEVKLLLKGSSEQAKLKLIKEGHQNPAEVGFYKEALTKFDSVELADYEKI
jgi:Ni/Fe-hydrogenase subunit HybB-like protein